MIYFKDMTVRTVVELGYREFCKLLGEAKGVLLLCAIGQLNDMMVVDVCHSRTGTADVGIKIGPVPCDFFPDSLATCRSGSYISDTGSGC